MTNTILTHLLINYGPYVVLIGAFIGFNLWKNRKLSAKEQILALFLEAEKLDIVGPEKLKYVADFVYNNMDIGKKFMSQEQAEQYLQMLYDQTKATLAEKKIDAEQSNDQGSDTTGPLK